MEKKKTIEIITLMVIMLMVGYICVKLGADIKMHAERLTQQHYEKFVDLEAEENVPLGEHNN